MDDFHGAGGPYGAEDGRAVRFQLSLGKQAGRSGDDSQYGAELYSDGDVFHKGWLDRTVSGTSSAGGDVVRCADVQRGRSEADASGHLDDGLAGRRGLG